ncbi:MAG TPA: helix-turn-helix transcriptional regulator, partial [Gammaproteobacteria bacterium]|nr:helix-turn-helix transcriptional regulator [Gammaproteobacteria bacterium]
GGASGRPEERYDRAITEPVPVFRAAHLLLYLSALREIGVPWVGELHRARLPTMLIERPDAYLPLLRSLKFLAACERRVEDLAVLGARRLGMQQMSAPVAAAIAGAQTLSAALRSLKHVVGLEATRVAAWMELGPTVMLRARTSVPREAAGRHFAEWHMNLALVKLVRIYAGPEWRPREMAFESEVRVTRLVREEFPNTRFSMSQRSCGIALPCPMLALPGSDRHRVRAVREVDAGVAPARDFVDSLRVLLKTYLAEGSPTIKLVADLADTSVRTLQRRLARAGVSYSDLLDDVRLEAASRLLTDGANDVIDIAYELGYGEASSFSRAFRRLAGLSPRQYRRARSWPVPAANESSAA